MSIIIVIIFYTSADMPLLRKMSVLYHDGVYEIADHDRPNVLLISNITQNGITGFGSTEKTGLFVSFGMVHINPTVTFRMLCTPKNSNTSFIIYRSACC